MTSTPTPEPRFEPRRSRRILGPLFGAACLLATLTGVVVLSVLLGAVVGAAARVPAVPAPAPGDTSAPPEAAARFRSPGELADLVGRLIRATRSGDPDLAGFKVGIAGSLWLLGIVFATTIPVGVGAAVFLEEYAPPGRFRRLIQTNIANLAAVPSIVYGILGLAVFVRGLGVKGYGYHPALWAGGLTLSLLVLPVVVIATQEALRTVPPSLRQAALALGATKWQVIRDHVLPMALPGILTGAILALSRAIGETAPLLMVGAAASISKLPRGLRSRFTALPVEIYNFAKEPDPKFQAVAAGGILLLVALLLTMNATAIVIRSRYGRSARG